MAPLRWHLCLLSQNHAGLFKGERGINKNAAFMALATSTGLTCHPPQGGWISETCWEVRSEL
eukprot:15480485-Alexandrium_andersonii.AAC.1